MIEACKRQFELSRQAFFTIRSLISNFVLIASLIALSGCLSDEGIGTPSLPTGTGNISNTNASSFSPAIASVGNTVYIVWADTVDDIQDIFLVRSGDGGQNFSLPFNVSKPPDSKLPNNASTSPQIAVSGTTVYVVWEEFILDKPEFDIFFRKAEDNSGVLNNWSKTKNLSLSDLVCDDGGTNPAGPVCPSQFPTIAADGNFVLVAWSELTNYVLVDITTGNTGKDFRIVNSDTLLVASSDQGDLFSFISATPTVVSKQNSTISLNPSLTTDQGTFYIAWSDFIPPNTDSNDAEIVFRSFNGTVFDPLIAKNERILSNPISGSGNPSLAASNGNTYLVWEGSPTTTPEGGCNPNSDIFMVKSTDGFATAPSGTPTNISNSTCRSNNGKISVSGDQVYIVWEDNSPNLSGILFSKSSDGGSTFTKAAKLTFTGGSVASPAISADAENLYTAWEDAVFGNIEIFFSKL